MTYPPIARDEILLCIKIPLLSGLVDEMPSGYKKAVEKYHPLVV
jgi:hypothetical protein